MYVNHMTTSAVNPQRGDLPTDPSKDYITRKRVYFNRGRMQIANLRYAEISSLPLALLYPDNGFYLCVKANPSNKILSFFHSASAHGIYSRNAAMNIMTSLLNNYSDRKRLFRVSGLPIEVESW